MYPAEKALTSPMFRKSRPVAFRDHMIRLVDVDGETWICAKDVADAIDTTFKFDDRDWVRNGVLMANIDGGYAIMNSSSQGVTSMLCVSLQRAKSLAAGSMALTEDVRVLWDWIEQLSPKWENAAARELQRRRMALFNEFHRVRRFANEIGYDEARKHALEWIEILDEIDGCTTLEQRFDLAGTNVAHRQEMIDSAKEHGSRLTMHAILSVWKGGHTATYRPRNGCGCYGEQFGTHLSWFTTIDRKDLNPLAQFFDLGRGFPEKKQPVPNSLAEQFADLMEKRGNLVELSRQNQQQAAESGMRNVAVMYGAVATLHKHVLSMFREASADGSVEAIESAIAKATPFCEEATETECEIVKILKSDAEDAPPRTIH